MAYWITTQIRFDRPVAGEILERFGENGVLKFQKVIPIPEELNYRISDDTIRTLLLMYHSENNKNRKKEIKETIDHLQLPQLVYAFTEEMRIKAEAGEKPAEAEKEIAEKCLSNYRKYHHVSRYDAREDLWGTEEEIKRGTFESTEDSFSFVTKYDIPMGIITYLSVLYSDVAFQINVKEDSGDSYRIVMIDGEEPL